MDGAAFDHLCETQLAPLWHLATSSYSTTSTSTKARAAQALAARGAWFLFLPKYSPDLNPIEMAFAKLKAHLRKDKARTYDALWKALGDICDLFTPQECWNFFRKAEICLNVNAGCSSRQCCDASVRFEPRAVESKSCPSLTQQKNRLG